MAEIHAVREQLRRFGLLRIALIPAKEGGVSQFWTEVKESFGVPERLQLMADGLWLLMPPRTTCVAASGLGGIPLAVAISIAHGLRLTMIREVAKTHGKGGVIEGYVPRPNDNVVVVDDKLVTGERILRAKAAIERTGATVASMCVVVDSREVRTELSVQCLLTLDDLRLQPAAK